MNKSEKSVENEHLKGTFLLESTMTLSTDTGIDSKLLDPQILADFAHALKEYKLKGKSDEFGIIREFRSIAATKAQEVAVEGISTTDFEDWDLEVKLWHLVELLFQYRYSEKPSKVEAHGYNSNIVFEEKYYQSNPKLYEIWLVITWIHQNSIVNDRPQLTTSKWLNTKLSNTLANFDVDAPLRTKTTINPVDQEQDIVFYKYILDLLLAGNYKEASDECERTNNWTLRMILAGVNEYIDPLIDSQIDEEIDESTHGIKRKALWRRTVYLLSKNESLSLYERAIYGFLVGELTPLELSTNWDQDLLIYLNHILTNDVENQLIEEGRFAKEDLIVNFPRTNQTVQSVLNAIANSRKEESEHPLRVLIASVISNNIRPIIHSSLSFVGNIMLGNEDSNELLNETYTLRVVTHLAIFVSLIDPSSIDEQDKSRLLTTYILVLRLYGQYDLIPLYVSFLPESEARDAYSLFLIDLFDSDLRPKQLELSRLYRLPLENILKRTVERVFSLTEDHYELRTGVSLRDTDEVDNRLIRGVEWFIEAKMYSDAVHATVALFRRFLLTGRTRAVQEFASRNSTQQLLKYYDIESIGALVEEQVSDNERKEIQQYDTLITAFNAIDEWQVTSKRVRTIAFVDTINRVSSILYDTINNLLVELSYSDYEPELIQDLRSLYIPYLIIQLHNIYLDGESHDAKYLRNALDLTKLVASESTKYYLLFQNCDRLKEYLSLVAHCAALAAGSGV